MEEYTSAKYKKINFFKQISTIRSINQLSLSNIEQHNRTVVSLKKKQLKISFLQEQQPFRTHTNVLYDFVITNLIILLLQQQNMYRNTYLQLYKNSASNTSNLTLLLSHFSQIYNTLGCVLQDLQFQIGKIISQDHQPSIGFKDQREPQKRGGKDKQIIKLEESQIQNQDKNIVVQNQLFNKQGGNKPNRKQPPKKEQNYSQQSDCNWMMDRILNEASRKSKGSVETKQKPFLETVRIAPKISGNDSFDSLFQSKKQKPVKMQIEVNSKHLAPLPSIPQQPGEYSQSGIGNTYQDFLDRIFKEGEPRKSKQTD